MQAIISLIGEPGTGKTTLTHVLGDELTPASILYIDASPDQRLTLLLAPQQPPLTLAHLVHGGREVTGTREAIDWAFNDLSVSAGEDNDLLTVGPLDTDLQPAEIDKIRYGLTRLIEEYDYVLVDGFHPLIQVLLPEERLHTLTVLTPAQLAQWRAPDNPVRTPLVILNQYQEAPLPERFEQALLQGQARLIGKLPRYASPEETIRRLADDFHNCLLRMDIPLNLTSP